MNIKCENLYLLRIDFDCFIVYGFRLKETFDFIKCNKLIRIEDIAGNFLQKPYTDETKISFQELYNIKSIEVV